MKLDNTILDAVQRAASFTSVGSLGNLLEQKIGHPMRGKDGRLIGRGEYMIVYDSRSASPEADTAARWMFVGWFEETLHVPVRHDTSMPDSGDKLLVGMGSLKQRQRQRAKIALEHLAVGIVHDEASIYFVSGALLGQGRNGAIYKTGEVSERRFYSLGMDFRTDRREGIESSRATIAEARR
tara:strand:+ start:10982 stop:11527 length:546 start_codon:yes stop_codon:yes gene_type:complete